MDTAPPTRLGGTVFTVVGKDPGIGSIAQWFFGLQNGSPAFHINGPAYGSGRWKCSDELNSPSMTTRASALGGGAEDNR